jgi:hypothetical protein
MHAGLLMFISILETTNFSFFGSGFTQAQSVDGLRVAWGKHCQQYQADPEYGADLINEEEFKVLQFPVGKGSPDYGDEDLTPDEIPVTLRQFKPNATPTGKSVMVTTTRPQLDSVLSHAEQVKIAFIAFQAGTLKMDTLADILSDFNESIDNCITRKA